VDLGSFTSGLLTGLREGVEAALIISILVAYLVRTGNRQHVGRIWVGTGAAVLVSVIAGVALFVTVGELQAPWEQVFEGLTMLLAASVVTWMLFWMRRQSGSVRGTLQAALERALTDGAVFGLVLLAFTAVIREGLETSLFLVGLATSSRGEAPSVMLGAVGGLLIAALLGAGFYRGARVIDLRTFFRWTGIALIFIAAGMLSSAVHEFIEIGWITVGSGTAFDLSAVLPHVPIDGAPGGLALVVGQFLHALLGYSSQPEVAMVVVWVAYVGIVLALFLRPVAQPVPRPATSEGPSAAEGTRAD
jgi:high-affinity iron transporter